MPSMIRYGKRLQQHPVHEGARVALVAVAEDVLHLRTGSGVANARPISCAVENPAPPRPRRPALLDFLEDLFAASSSFAGSRCQRLKTVVPQILVQVRDGSRLSAILGRQVPLSTQGTRQICPIAKRPARGRVTTWIGLSRRRNCNPVAATERAKAYPVRRQAPFGREVSPARSSSHALSGCTRA